MLLVATKAYAAALLSRQAGRTAKDKLVTLGLSDSERILVRAGRGGNALVLEPTPQGYALVGRAHPVGSKGGDGRQHRWLIQELAARLPGASIETLVGEKSVDLLVLFDPARHGRLLFHMEEKSIEAGALVAIEVETSSPSKTAPNNVTKNSAVGIARTIVAVLPKNLDATIAALTSRVRSDLRRRYTVAAVFELLVGLQR